MVICNELRNTFILLWQMFMRLFKVIVFCLAIFTVTVSGYAQMQGQPLADSLLREINSDKYRNTEDTNKVKLFNALSQNYSRVKADDAIKYGQQALALATKLIWKKGIALANSNLADGYMFKGDYANALKYLLIKVRSVEASGNKNELIEVYRDIGLCYSEKTDYQRASEYYFKALDKAKELSDAIEIARILANISLCFEDRADYTNAKEYLMKAFQASKSTNVRAFFNKIGENSLTPGHDFKAAQMRKELENLESTIAINSGNPGDSSKASEFMLKEGLSVLYDKKMAAAENESEREELKIEEDMKRKQIEYDFELKSAAAEAQKKLEEERLQMGFAQKEAKEEQARKQVLLDKKNNDAVNAANLKTERSYRFAAIAFASFLLVIAGIISYAYQQKHKANNIIKKLVNEQEQTIAARTKELAESNEKRAHANRKLVELVQFNAHRMREPLTRIMGAMSIMEHMTPEEFCKEITPEIDRAVKDLDNSIMQVITLADDTIELYGQ
jgi:tetratricopeptide (TPR) repeat protein